MTLTDILFRQTDRDPDTLRVKESRKVGSRNIIRYEYPIDWHKVIMVGLGGALSLYLIADDFVRKPSCLDYAYGYTTGAMLNLAGYRPQMRAPGRSKTEDSIRHENQLQVQETTCPAQEETPTASQTQVPTPLPAACPTSVPSSSSAVQVMKNYEVQIAACRIRSNAARLYTAIVEEGIDDVKLAEENIDCIPFYKVKFGSFGDVNQAKQCKYDLERRLSSVMRDFKIDDLVIVEKEVYMISVSRDNPDRNPETLPAGEDDGKSRFIDGLKSFMMEINSRYVGARYTSDADIKYHSLDADSSDVWANAIYEVMDKYNLPPEFIKIFAHEGGFDPNALGDLNHKWGPSDGPAQILMESQLEIWTELDKAGYVPPEGYVKRDIETDPDCQKTKLRWKKAKKDLPKDMPDIRADARIYCEFAAMRFRQCLDNQYSHAILSSDDYDVSSVDESEVIKSGVGAYNAGPRSWKTNKDGYTEKVYSIEVPSEVEKFAVSLNDGNFLGK